MPGIRTSSIFYRRGVSNSNKLFGFQVYGNYPIYQPANLTRKQFSNNKPQPNPPFSKTVPGPPIDLSANASNAEAILFFTQPISDGGSAITNYSYAIDTPEGIYTYIGISTNPITITGLTNGQSYIFYMKATNAIGNSIASAPSNTVMPEPIAPGPPTDLSANLNNMDYTEIILGWLAPISNGGSAITNYSYAINDPSGSYTFIGISTNPYTITGLIIGQSYTFYMKATNAVGDSVASTPSNTIVIPQPIPPGPPTDLSANINDMDYTEIILGWLAPTSNGGSAITNYSYAINDPSGTYTFIGISTNPYTITGLIIGQSYTFYMKATNVVGDSVASTPSNTIVIPEPTPPGPPIITGGSFQNNNIAVITFTQESYGGLSLTNYLYSLDGSGGSFIPFSPAQTTSPVTINVSNGLSYNICLKAVNSIGSSDFSNTLPIQGGLFIYTLDLLSGTVSDISNNIPITSSDNKIGYSTSIINTAGTNYEIDISYSFIDNNVTNDGLIFGNYYNFYNNIINLTITQFGSIPFTRIGTQFQYISNIVFSASDIPTILTNTNGSYMFNQSFNFNSNINSWNTTNLIKTDNMFYRCTSFNQPLNLWNTSNVIDMNYMFFRCNSFNQPLNSWNISNVINTYSMFTRCNSFNQPLNSWNTSNVINMSGMFERCSSFNQPLNSWNTSNVTNMNSMFRNCSSFNQPLNTWNTSKVIDMQNMFFNCNSFNQSLSYDSSNNYWNTSNVTNINNMFFSASIFNNGQNIGGTTNSLGWLINNAITLPVSTFCQNTQLTNINAYDSNGNVIGFS